MDPHRSPHQPTAHFFVVLSHRRLFSVALFHGSLPSRPCCVCSGYLSLLWSLKSSLLHFLSDDLPGPSFKWEFCVHIVSSNDKKLNIRSRKKQSLESYSRARPTTEGEIIREIDPKWAEDQRSRQKTSRIICRCKRIEFHWDKFYYTTPSRLKRVYIYNWNLTPRLCVVQANIAAQNERDITEQTRLDKCEVTIVSRAAKHRTFCLELAQSIDRLFCTKFQV